MTEEERRRVGRPSTGERIEVRIPADVLDVIDAEADQLETTRAAIIREILEAWCTP
jgi:predicted DNA-binding protein